MLDKEKVRAFIKGAYVATNSPEVRSILVVLETQIICGNLDVKEVEK